MSKVVRFPKVILYGDSITEQSFGEHGKWGALLADHLSRKCDILNRGFSGYTSRMNKIMLPCIFSKSEAPDVAAVTLFLGANDSNKPCGGQHVPLGEYKENMKSMVEQLQDLGISSTKVILIGTPPVDVDAWGEHCKATGKTMTKDNALAGEYSKAGAEVATQTGVVFVELYKSMMEHKQWREFFSDGLHLSPSGSKFLFQALYPEIDKLTNHLPRIMPSWDEVDHANPAASLLSG